MTCPDCEYNKARAANWRSEAYRLGGHDYIPRLWVGLTRDETEALSYKAEGNTWTAVELTEAKLKEKNG